MNIFQTNHAITKTGRKWKWTGVLIPLLAVMISTAQTQAAATNVGDPLLNAAGQPMTLGQMAYQFARGLTPPFLGSREADAITWLMGGQVGEQPGHLPPLSPIGGWTNPSRPATAGDLTVILVQQLRIEPDAAAGGTPTAQDFQNALVGYMGTVSTTTYNAIASVFSDWVNSDINPLGPQPSSGEQPRTPTNP